MALNSTTSSALRAALRAALLAPPLVEATEPLAEPGHARQAGSGPRSPSARAAASSSPSRAAAA